MFDEEISAGLFSTIQDAQVKYYEKIRHPFVAGLELTPLCNMRCVHCYMSDNENDKMLTATEWKAIIDKLCDAGVLIMYMTGGEIFTRKDFAEIYVYAKKKGFIIELLTNATALTDELLEVFNEYPPSTISISVYGMSEKTYAAVTQRKGVFDRFKKNVEKLVENDLDVELKFIGLKDNIADFDKAESWAKELGVRFKFNLEMFPTLNGGKQVLEHRLTNKEIIEFEKGRENIYKIYSVAAEKGNPFINAEKVPVFTCNVASTLLYIDSLGYLSPCNKMRLTDHNVLTESIEDIWKDYVNKYAYMVAPKNYKCAKCKNIHLCAPCPVINKLSTGSYTEPCPEACELSCMRVEEFTKEKYKKG